MKKIRAYIFSRPFLGERAPQHIQNLVIREYCSRMNLQYLLSLVEYCFDNSSLMVEKALDELNKIDGIIFYSLYQMPSHKKERKNLYEKILKKKKELHYALEEITVNNLKSAEHVENIYLIKQTLPHCLENFGTKE